MEYPQTKFNPDWVKGNVLIDDDVIKWTKSFGKYLSFSEGYKSTAMSTSQIRKFFGEIKKIQADFNKYGTKVPLLDAKLAYAVGKNRKSKIKQFYEQIKMGIHSVKNDKSNFDRLVSIIESIVAFHKFHEENLD